MNRRRFLKAGASAVVGLPLITRGAANDGFEIGLVADAQYADADAKGTRYYRKSLGRLAESVEDFNGRDLAFCVHLGDLIDHDWKSFDDITRPLARSRQTWHHLLGNHDFEVLEAEKARVPQRLSMTTRYGSFDHGAFRFVILDTNDVSTYATDAGTSEHAAAEKELARLKSAHAAQAQPWNGGVGAPQLAWFDRVCAEAKAAGRRVVIFAHHPVLPASQHIVWNSAEVLAAIDRHPHIVAWLNGHNHAGAFAERSGVPFLTMHGMVETPDTTAYATARILADRIVLTGHGREPSREMKFKPV